ncbi:MAG: leucine-rich repeat domain-containing protein [Clostridia bacterium]
MRAPARALMGLLCLFGMLLCLPIAAQAQTTVEWQKFESYELLAKEIKAQETTELSLGTQPISSDLCRRLLDDFPNVQFTYLLAVYGLNVDCNAQTLDLQKLQLPNMKDPKNVDALCDMLSCLPKLTRVDMFKNFVPKKMMPIFAERFPKIRFGWTIGIRDYRIRTDLTAFSTLKDGSPPYIKSEELEILRYCKDLVALDLGHNSIAGLDFLYGLPQLKVLIVAVNNVTDITPIASLQNLEYLELFNNQITDISPLAKLGKLMDLNLCYNPIDDFSCLEGLTSLDRLWLGANKRLSPSELAQLKKALPHTTINSTARDSTGEGWRKHDRYWVIRKMFKTSIYLPWDADIGK